MSKERISRENVQDLDPRLDITRYCTCDDQDYKVLETMARKDFFYTETNENDTWGNVTRWFQHTTYLNGSETAYERTTR